MSFNVGEKVKRIGSSFIREDMIQGEVYEVAEVKNGTMRPTGSQYWYSQDRFSLHVPVEPIGDPDDSPVEHPAHYNSHPSGVECITIARYHNFNIGNVFKYLWRIGLKGAKAATKTQRLEEIDKAIFYLRDERARIEAEDE